ICGANSTSKIEGLLLELTVVTSRTSTESVAAATGSGLEHAASHGAVGSRSDTPAFTATPTLALSISSSDATDPNSRIKAFPKSKHGGKSKSIIEGVTGQSAVVPSSSSTKSVVTAAGSILAPTTSHGAMGDGFNVAVIPQLVSNIPHKPPVAQSTGPTAAQILNSSIFAKIAGTSSAGPFANERVIDKDEKMSTPYLLWFAKLPSTVMLSEVFGKYKISTPDIETIASGLCGIRD
ncbi:hypothetical protein HDU76_010996, partial [Blyttiomyces sp. JEL0837]